MDQLAIDRQDYAFQENSQAVSKYEEYLSRSDVVSWNLYLPPGAK